MTINTNINAPITKLYEVLVQKICHFLDLKHISIISRCSKNMYNYTFDKFAYKYIPIFNITKLNMHKLKFIMRHKKLCFNGTVLEYNALPQEIQNNFHCISLDYYTFASEYKDINMITTFIKNNTKVTSLDLASTNTRNIRGLDLIDLIKYNNTITSLDLSNNNFNEFDNNFNSKLNNAIKVNNTISYLNLSFNKGIFIADAIKFNSTITSLSISGSNIGDIRCKDLICAINSNVNCALTSLNICENKLNISGIDIANLININTKLTILNISSNYFGSITSNAIIDAVTSNKSLKDLNMSHNMLMHMNCLVTLIKTNRTLTSLDISNCGCSKYIYSSIINASKLNCTLTTLKHNSIFF